MEVAEKEAQKEVTSSGTLHVLPVYSFDPSYFIERLTKLLPSGLGSYEKLNNNINGISTCMS